MYRGYISYNTSAAITDPAGIAGHITLDPINTTLGDLLALLQNLRLLRQLPEDVGTVRCRQGID